jgi:predicted nucleotidyltransferase
MHKTEVIEILKRYKELLSKHMGFEFLVLFGSYARNTQREDSDIDVAVVVDEISGDYFETRPLLWKIGREVDDRIEPLILEKKHDASGFLEEVMRSGIVI